MKMNLYKIDIFKKSKLSVFWFETKHGCHSVYAEHLDDARRMFNALPELKKKLRIEKREYVNSIHFYKSK